VRAIFLSYRRDDAEGEAGRLFRDLTAEFGADKVFIDVSGIEFGLDFRKVIEKNVASCGVVLTMIGKNWIDAKDEEGRRRLDDPMDFVRLETASALSRDIPVIPVLVHGGRMPQPQQLPEDLRDLAYRNGIELTHARWDSDVQVLIKALRPHVAGEREEAGVKSGPAPLDQPSGKSTAPNSREAGGGSKPMDESRR
jgi:TIR domain